MSELACDKNNLPQNNTGRERPSKDENALIRDTQALSLFFSKCLSKLAYGVERQLILVFSAENRGFFNLFSRPIDRILVRSAEYTNCCHGAHNLYDQKNSDLTFSFEEIPIPCIVIIRSFVQKRYWVAMIMMQIGIRLRQIRHSHKQTLAEVGAATDLSISYLSKIERGITEPTLEALNKLAQHFDASISDFLIESEQPNLVNSIDRPSFREFIEKMNGQVDSAMQDVLLHVDTVANKPANSVDEWLQYYYVISAVTSKA